MSKNKTPDTKDVADLLELMVNAEASLMAATYGGPQAQANLQDGIARFRRARKRCRQMLTRLDHEGHYAGSHVQGKSS